MRPGPHLTAWHWSSPLSFPLSHLDSVPSRALYAMCWNPLPHGLGSWALIRLECPALWKRPSLTLGSRSSFIPTPGLMFLYFQKTLHPWHWRHLPKGATTVIPEVHMWKASPPGPQNMTLGGAVFSLSFHCLRLFVWMGLLGRQMEVPRLGIRTIHRSIGALAAGLRHSHSNATSKPGLRPTPQLMATLDPSLPERGQGSNLNTPGSFSGSVPGQHPRKPCSRVCTERAEIRSLRWPLIQ